MPPLSHPPSEPPDATPADEPPAAPVAPRKRKRKAARGPHGGARAGAGRKQSKLPADTISRVGPPPLDSPLQMARWWGKLLGEVAWLRIAGRAHKSLIDDLRSLAAVAKTLIPEELRAEVDRLLRENDEKKKNTQAGGAKAPQTETQDGQHPTLRRNPR